jgi:hypothetical protein
MDLNITLNQNFDARSALSGLYLWLLFLYFSVFYYYLNQSFPLMLHIERYRSLAPMYYRGAAAAIVVFDITNQTT